MIRRRSVAALFLHAGLAHGLSVHISDPAVPAEAQAGILEKKANYEVGDHVFTELIDGEKTSWVKGSVSGRGVDPNSYNVHLWVGPPKRRDMHDVSVELLRDARQLEELEQLQKRTEEEAIQKAAEHEQELKRQRKAAEAAAHQRALEEAERRAREQREAAERVESERKAAKAAAEEAARQEAERAKEQEKVHKRELKAKWEAVKVAKERTSELRDAFELLSSEAAREAKAFQQQQEDMKGQVAAQIQNHEDRTIHLVVRDPDGREVSIGLARKTPFRVMMHSACRRLQCDPEKSRFTVDGAGVGETDTVGRLGLANNDVVKVWPEQPWAP